MGHPVESVFAGIVAGCAYQSAAHLLTNSLGQLLEAAGGDRWETPLKDITFNLDQRERLFASPEKVLSALVSEQLRRPAPSLFGSLVDRDASYQRGRSMVLVSVLEGLPIPVETRLSWRQVLEFRSDSESRDRLRRFARWLDSALIGRSESQITDEILIKLEDYRRALAKHGIETRMGAFERVVSWQPMLAKLTSFAAGAALGEPIAGMIGAGSVAIGELAIALHRSRLSLDAIHKQHEDISFVFELAKDVNRESGPASS